MDKQIQAQHVSVFFNEPTDLIENTITFQVVWVLTQREQPCTVEDLEQYTYVCTTLVTGDFMKKVPTAIDRLNTPLTFYIKSAVHTYMNIHIKSTNTRTLFSHNILLLKL